MTTSFPATRTSAPCSDSMMVSFLNVLVCSRRSSSVRIVSLSFIKKLIFRVKGADNQCMRRLVVNLMLFLGVIEWLGHVEFVVLIAGMAATLAAIVCTDLLFAG